MNTLPHLGRRWPRAQAPPFGSERGFRDFRRRLDQPAQDAGRPIDALDRPRSRQADPRRFGDRACCGCREDRARQHADAGLPGRPDEASPRQGGGSTCRARAASRSRLEFDQPTIRYRLRLLPRARHPKSLIPLTVLRRVRSRLPAWAQPRLRQQACRSGRRRRLSTLGLAWGAHGEKQSCSRFMRKA